MHRRRDFLLFATLAAAATRLPWGKTQLRPRAASSATQIAASVPDFSRMWANSLGPGFSPPASGPGPVLNKARQRAAVDIYGKPLNATNAPIVSAGGRRVGDYTAPILAAPGGGSREGARRKRVKRRPCSESD